MSGKRFNPIFRRKQNKHKSQKQTALGVAYMPQGRFVQINKEPRRILKCVGIAGIQGNTLGTLLRFTSYRVIRSEHLLQINYPNTIPPAIKAFEKVARGRSFCKSFSLALSIQDITYSIFQELIRHLKGSHGTYQA